MNFGKLITFTLSDISLVNTAVLKSIFFQSEQMEVYTYYCNNYPLSASQVGKLRAGKTDLKYIFVSWTYSYSEFRK